MSLRPKILPQVVLNAGDMSTNLTSAVTIIQSLSMMSYALSWSGSTPVGTVSVQVSNDYSQYPNGLVNNAGTWTSLYLTVNGTSGQTVAISGNSGTCFIDIDQLGAYAVRLIYAKTSGTGNITATFCGKVA